MRKFIAATCALLMFSNSAWAQLSTVGTQLGSGSPANEFFVGRELGKPLVTVNLLSGVARPGVYHIPTGTDLAGLIAYAGGAMDKSDMTEVSLRRLENGSTTQHDINFQKIANSQKAFPQLANNDVVYIPPRNTLENTITWIALLSSIASVALSVALINDVNKRN